LGKAVSPSLGKEGRREGKGKDEGGKDVKGLRSSIRKSG
jgi:hypothetical protein